MITIKVTKGVPYIWDPQDWLKLRKELRIIGVLDGVVGKTWNLPVRLSTVEAQYLVKHGIARALHAPKLYYEMPIIDEEQWERFMSERRKEHVESIKNGRKEEIEIYFDEICEGKKKRGGAVLDKEVFIDEEMRKIESSRIEMAQVDLGDPWLTDEDYLPYDFPIPQTYVEKLRLKVFEDFHMNKGYWVTPGIKFGGDYLAYPGDPGKFHAEFIIICPDENEAAERRIASQCRLSLTVRKTLLIAKLIDEKLMYYVPLRKF